MKTLNYCLGIILFTIFLNTNLYSQAPEILWMKNYGSSTGDDYGYSVIETEDRSLVVAGYTNSVGAGGYDVWLLKTDANGDTLWTRTYGGAGDEYGYSVKQTDDGGYIICGATTSYGAGGSDYWVIKTNSLGDTLWTRTFGGINNDICQVVEITEDGGYILVGEKDAYPTADSDIWIIKTNFDGQMEWQKSYGNDNDDERGYAVNRSNDGGFIIAGSNGCNGYASCEGWLLKTDSNGDTIWTKTFGTSIGSDSFKSVLQTTDGGYINTGISSIEGGGYFGDVWLLKTDSLGNEEWSNYYDYDSDSDEGYSVQQTSDGGYIISGEALPYELNSHAWIIRTNSFGDTLWTKIIRSYTKSLIGFDASTSAYSNIETQNGDYVVVGAQTQISFQKEVLLLRIASDIIPVELTSFTATAEAKFVSLNWQTATETNNSGFEIERTSPLPSPYEGEGATLGWSVVGFVPGFGTTTEPKNYSFIDENVSAGTYQYRLKQIDFDGSFEYSNTVEVEISAPLEFSLEQNYPNPFNPTTIIKYTIPSVTLRQAQGNILVSLKVFDVLGNEVATLVNEEQPAGSYEVEFNSVSSIKNLVSGVYFYQLKAGGFVETRKMILMK